MSTVTTLIQAHEVVNQGIVQGAPTTGRFDAMLLSSHLHIAEQRFLHPFTNAEFYNDLIAEKNPMPSNYNPSIGAIVNAFPSNAAYEKFWTQYLYPYLSRAVLYEAMPFIQMQTTSQGDFLNTPMGSQNTGVAGLKAKQKHLFEQLEVEKSRVLKFLCDNSMDYPLWDKSTYCDDCKDYDDREYFLGFVI